MSVANDIQRVMSWLRDDVCPMVTLKIPPSQSNQDAQSYEFETGHPVVYGMYWPVEPQNAPDVTYTHPGILVQLRSGRQEGLTMTLDLRLHLGAWNNGRHPQDTWSSDGPQLSQRADGAYLYGPYDRDEGDGFQPIFEDGWMDCLNFLDTVRRELASVGSIGPVAVQDGSIEFGPYKENDAAINLYPFWFSYIDVTVTEAVAPASNFNDFL